MMPKLPTKERVTLLVRWAVQHLRNSIGYHIQKIGAIRKSATTEIVQHSGLPTHKRKTTVSV